MFESVFEIFFLIIFITSSFFGFSLLLLLKLFSFFSWKSCLFSFFSFLIKGSFLGSDLSIVFLLELFIFFALFHFLFLNVHEINSSQFLEDIHESWVTLDQLHQHLWIFLACVPHVSKLWIFKVSSNSWVSSQFCFSFWTTEKISHTTSTWRLRLEASIWTSTECFGLLISHDSLHATLDLSIGWINFES